MSEVCYVFRYRCKEQASEASSLLVISDSAAGTEQALDAIPSRFHVWVYIVWFVDVDGFSAESAVYKHCMQVSMCNNNIIGACILVTAISFCAL